jgi:hypothetical protein
VPLHFKKERKMDIRSWAEQRLRGLPMDLLLNLALGCVGCDKAILVWKGDVDNYGDPKFHNFINIDSGHMPSPIKVLSEQIPAMTIYLYRQDVGEEIANQPRLFSFPAMDDQQRQQLPLFWFNNWQIETVEIVEYNCDYAWYCMNDNLCRVILEYLAVNYQGLPTDHAEIVLEMKWLLKNCFCLSELSIFFRE